MAVKPREIKYSQTAIEVENYVLQRGQSLQLSADLNSEEVNQFATATVVEVVDDVPSVNITLDSNEFGSVALLRTLGKYFQAESYGKVRSSELGLYPVDILVSVKNNSSYTTTSRSAWLSNYYPTSISGSYSVDGLATENIAFSGDNLTWYNNTDTSTGACKVLRFIYLNDSTLLVDARFDATNAGGARTTGYLHALTEDGATVSTNYYTFNSTGHYITAQAGKVFSSTARYRGLFWNRASFPAPNDAATSPVGGISAKEVEIIMWDEKQTELDWETDLGKNTSSQTLRVQSVDYEITFDTESLKELKTGEYHNSLNSTTITATLTLNDSDLELLAKAAGYTENWEGRTGAATLTEITLGRFQSTKTLCMCINIFNTKTASSQDYRTLMKQVFFYGGKLISYNDSRDVPGRGTHGLEVRFSGMVVKGTGNNSRASNNLWGGKDFAFVFVTDDNTKHNAGWVEETFKYGYRYTISTNNRGSKHWYPYLSYGLSVDEAIDYIQKGYDLGCNHSYSHANNGMAVGATQYGTLAGYFRTANFADQSLAARIYSTEIRKDILLKDYTYNATDSNKSDVNVGAYMPYNWVKTFVYPGGVFDHTIMWDIEKSGYYMARAVVATTVPATMGANLNSREAISVMRMPLACTSTALVGTWSAAPYTEAQVRAAVKSEFAKYQSGGANDGGVAILYTHSFGKDYTSSSYGGLITAYNDGIKKNEIVWIMDEIEKMGGRVMTFADAATEYRRHSYRVSAPGTTYGGTYANDVVYAYGTPVVNKKYETPKLLKAYWPSATFTYSDGTVNLCPEFVLDNTCKAFGYVVAGGLTQTSPVPTSNVYPCYWERLSPTNYIQWGTAASDATVLVSIKTGVALATWLASGTPMYRVRVKFAPKDSFCETDWYEYIVNYASGPMAVPTLTRVWFDITSR